MRIFKIVVVIGLTLCSLVGVSQNSDTSFVFQRYYGKQKDVALKPGKEITINMFQSIDPITNDTLFSSVYGTLVSVNQSTVTIELNTEYSKYYSNVDNFRENYVKYSNPTSKEYNKGMIEYITYKPKARGLIEIATISSVISLLVLAPLSAINVKDGTINSNAYLNIAVPAAIFAAVSIPLYYYVGDRKIKIKR